MSETEVSAGPELRGNPLTASYGRAANGVVCWSRWSIETAEQFIERVESDARRLGVSTVIITSGKPREHYDAPPPKPAPKRPKERRRHDDDDDEGDGPQPWRHWR